MDERVVCGGFLASFECFGAIDNDSIELVIGRFGATKEGEFDEGGIGDEGVQLDAELATSRGLTPSLRCNSATLLILLYR